jgi:hypothetical protein
MGAAQPKPLGSSDQGPSIFNRAALKRNQKFSSEIFSSEAVASQFTGLPSSVRYISDAAKNPPEFRFLAKIARARKTAAYLSNPRLVAGN